MKTQIVYRTKPNRLEIAELMALMPVLSIELIPSKPEITTAIDPFYKMKILDWNWFKSLFATDTDIACISLDKYELKNAGIGDHWGFYSLADGDMKHQFYITYFKNLDVRARKNGFKSSFVWMFVHEYLHGARWEETKDRERAAKDVHDWEEWGVLKAKLAEYMATYGVLEQKVSWLQKALELAKKLTQVKPKYIHPLDAPYKNNVSQHYGVKNSIYTKTGRHLGTDYPCPVGTPIKAPADGQLVVATSSPERGNYLQYKFDNYLLEVRHLSSIKPIGMYKQGDVIALSGNTGTKTTGAHACVVTWIGEDGISTINKDNWHELTTDSHLLYK